MNQVKIMADSTCDLSKTLIEEYDITIIPLHIVMEDKSYLDGEEVAPEEIYTWADANRTTPKTAAVSIERVAAELQPYGKAEWDVVFFGISEDMSTTCNVVRMVADELEYRNVAVIDSRNLSTGIGLQVLRAATMARAGKSAQEIVAEMERDRGLVRASFVVDTLTYLARGGRCTSVTALLGNTLKLHPRIEVIDGKMQVNKKYRGNLSKVILKYTEDMKEDLLKADPTRVFITHSGCDPQIVTQVQEYLDGLHYFYEVLETRAGGVVSSHCGPGTLGVLFYLKEM